MGIQINQNQNQNHDQNQRVGQPGPTTYPVDHHPLDHPPLLRSFNITYYDSLLIDDWFQLGDRATDSDTRVTQSVS